MFCILVFLSAELILGSLRDAICILFQLDSKLFSFFLIEYIGVTLMILNYSTYFYLFDLFCIYSILNYLLKNKLVKYLEVK